MTLTPQPEEVINAPKQLHGHVVVNEGVLQHARLEAQVADVFPHASLAALLVMPEEQRRRAGERVSDRRH